MITSIIKQLSNKIGLVIFLILFILPFFWFSSDKINIGGDATRLYFIFPYEWFIHSQYAVNSQATMSPYNPAFFLLPFVGLLSILKTTLLHSPIELNNFMMGFILAFSFITMYLLLKELFAKYAKTTPITLSLGSLAYVLSPLVIYEWYLALYYIFQLLVYPLIILLFIKYMRKDKFYYLPITAMVMFFSSIVFCFANISWVFAFFPITLVFLFYISIIEHRIRNFFSTSCIFIIIFLSSNAFHLAPQIFSVFDTFSLVNKFIFDKQWYMDRGMGFYMSIINRTRVAYNLLNQPPYLLHTANNSSFSELIYNWGVRYSILSIIIWGLPIFLLSKFYKLSRRNVITLASLTAINLVLLFLIAGNFGTWSHKVFEFLYSLPGFTMFRGYYHKFEFVSAFFRSLLFGFSIFLLHDISKNNKLFKIIVAISYLTIILNAIPLLSGKIFYQAFFQSDNVSYTIKIPDSYLNLLERIKVDPLVTRFATLPFTYESYQALQGETSGAYVGPSFISTTTNKGDLCGLDAFQTYKEKMLDIFREGRVDEFDTLLSTLGVGYIFYDQDEYIYTKLARIPYTQLLKDVLPTQSNVYEFVKMLEWQEIVKENKYYLFFNLNQFTPRVSATFKSTAQEQSKLSVEFTRINPTMYYVRIHHAKGNILLKLLEKINNNWHVFLYPTETAKKYTDSDLNNLTFEPIGLMPTNKPEVQKLYNTGAISTLGDLTNKNTRTYVWKDMIKYSSTNYVYNSNYISPFYRGSLQNDNLKTDLWTILKTIKTSPDISGNSYVSQSKTDEDFNAWSINFEGICNSYPSYCAPNEDGTNDITLILFFTPQLIFYASSIVTGIFLAIFCLLIPILVYRKKILYDITNRINRR